jgi:hypothetical protein
VSKVARGWIDFGGGAITSEAGALLLDAPFRNAAY